MQAVETMTERILYWLSLDMQVRALAERLLDRFAVTVGDLPASAAHRHAEPGGLYRYSLEVALKASEEFEGDMKMERRPDCSVDSFSSSCNRSRLQYATFIAALCHELGKPESANPASPRLLSGGTAGVLAGSAIVKCCSRRAKRGRRIFDEIRRQKASRKAPFTIPFTTHPQGWLLRVGLEGG